MLYNPCPHIFDPPPCPAYHCGPLITFYNLPSVSTEVTGI